MLEGPFGDHTGFYSLADYYPLVHVTAVTMKKEPVYPATLVGRPPMEDYYLGHATERIFLPLLKLTVPEIVDYHMPAPGIFHNLVFVSIDKQYPGQAYKVMNALWGQGLMSLAKVLVVVDKEVNVQDPDEAWWVALNNIDPERDVRFTMGPVDVLDHASRAFTYGSKMGIDATRKWKEEGFDREWPDRITMDEATKEADRRTVAPAWDPAEDEQGAGAVSGGRSSARRCLSAPAHRSPARCRQVAKARRFPATRCSSATSTSSSCRTPSSRCRSRCSASWRPRSGPPVTLRLGRSRGRVAFSAARWVAMGFNRIADREFDARNPRTAAPGAAEGRADAAPRHGSRWSWRSASSSAPPPCSIRSACCCRRSPWAG